MHNERVKVLSPAARESDDAVIIRNLSKASYVHVYVATTQSTTSMVPSDGLHMHIHNIILPFKYHTTCGPHQTDSGLFTHKWTFNQVILILC